MDNFGTLLFLIELDTLHHFQDALLASFRRLGDALTAILIVLNTNREQWLRLADGV